MLRLETGSGLLGREAKRQVSEGEQTFPATRLRAVLSQICLERAGAFATPEGAALIDHLRCFVAPRITAMTQAKGFMMDREEVVNLAVVGLCAEGGRAARISADALDPWAYLSVCLRNWAIRECGHRAWGHYDDAYTLAAPLVPESDLTPLREVVARAFDMLAPITDERLHIELHTLLGWLADNPRQRASYEFLSLKAARSEAAPSFTEVQVQAVMSIAWGGRKGEATQKRDSSLMYALLTHEAQGFRPSDFPILIRALVHYKKAMRAGAHAAVATTQRIAS